jgi:hypothetical protein
MAARDQVGEAGCQNESEIFRDTVGRKHSSAIAASKPSRHAA